MKWRWTVEYPGLPTRVHNDDMREWAAVLARYIHARAQWTIAMVGNRAIVFVGRGAWENCTVTFFIPK